MAKNLKDEKTARRRVRIAEAARKLFLSKGYRSTSMEEIALHAGYSKRTVYLDYISKDDIFLKIATDGLELLLVRLKSLTVEGMGLKEYMEAYLGEIIGFSVDHPGYFRMLTSDVTPDVIRKASHEQRERAASIEEAGASLLVGHIENAIADGVIVPVDPRETAEIIIGSATGIISLSLSGSQEILDSREIFNRVRTMGTLIFRGLEAEARNSL